MTQAAPPAVSGQGMPRAPSTPKGQEGRRILARQWGPVSDFRIFQMALFSPSKPSPSCIGPSVRRGARSDLSGQAPQKSPQTVQQVPVARVAVIRNNAGFIPTLEPPSQKKIPSPQIFSKIPKKILSKPKHTLRVDCQLHIQSKSFEVSDNFPL